MKRILSCYASDFRGLQSGIELKQAIADSEGRTVMAEVVAGGMPFYGGVSNAELLASFSADMLLLKGFDVLNPTINGIPDDSEHCVATLKKLTGRLIGINLEASADSTSDGLHVNEQAVQALIALEPDFVCITGYKSSAMTNEVFSRSLVQVRAAYSGLIIANRVEHPDNLDISSFIANGADVVMMPAPGSLPGVTEANLAQAVQTAQYQGALALATISTSQEGADQDTVKAIALSAKRAGCDMQNMGDANANGICDVESLLALSIAIRGRRHTYVRMAASINR